MNEQDRGDLYLQWVEELGVAAIPFAVPDGLQPDRLHVVAQTNVCIRLTREARPEEITKWKVVTGPIASSFWWVGEVVGRMA